MSTLHGVSCEIGHGILVATATNDNCGLDYKSSRLVYLPILPDEIDAVAKADIRIQIADSTGPYVCGLYAEIVGERIVGREVYEINPFVNYEAHAGEDDALSSIITGLLQKTTQPGIACAFSMPSLPIDATPKPSPARIQTILRLAGYLPIVVSPSEAVLEAFTNKSIGTGNGIAIVIDERGVDVGVMQHGKMVLTFSHVRGLDYIYSRTAFDTRSYLAIVRAAARSTHLSTAESAIAISLALAYQTVLRLTFTLLSDALRTEHITDLEDAMIFFSGRGAEAHDFLVLARDAYNELSPVLPTVKHERILALPPRAITDGLLKKAGKLS